MKNRLSKWIVILFFSLWIVGVVSAQDQANFTPIADNPVLVPGASGTWDAVSVRFPQIVFQAGTYYLFYGTFQSSTKPVSIGYATSTDGDHWTKFDGNPVLSGDHSGFDASGVTRPAVFVDTDGTWVMYYSGLAQVSQVFGTGIGRATAPSPSGPWTRADSPVLQSGSSGSWDSGFLFPDSVIHDGDHYVMYYSSGFSVGRATSSDGITWTKDAQPVLKPAPSGQWDSALAWGSSVRHTDNGWEMFYYGSNTKSGGAQIDIGYATSADGITWQRDAHNPVINLPDKQAFFPSFMLDPDGTYRVYYAVALNTAYTEIHLDKGTIPSATSTEQATQSVTEAATEPAS